MLNHPDLLTNLYNAFNPFEPLPADDIRYVNCQDVRGDADILQELGNRMRLANTNTCQLYSGHRGAGKSTELLKLKKYLENRQFYVVYFAADEEAIAAYDQAIKIQPDYHQAWYNKGIVLDDLGCKEEAIASYDTALEIQPDFHLAWYNKACYYALQGNIEQALENLQQAINLSPEEVREMAKTDSDFDSIRNDERFQAFIQ